MEAELKPCPFCGERAAVEPHDQHADVRWVECVACGCGTKYGLGNEALVAWNRRATDEALRARVAELEEALREISSRRPKIPPGDDGYPDSGNADDARDYGYDRAYTACADIADRALTPAPRQ